MSTAYTYAASNGPRVQSYTTSTAPVQYRTSYTSATPGPLITSYTRPPTNPSPPSYGGKMNVISSQPRYHLGPAASATTVLPPMTMDQLQGSTYSQPAQQQPSTQYFQSQQFQPHHQTTVHHHSPPTYVSSVPQQPPPMPQNMNMLQQHLRPVAPPSATHMGLPNLEYIVAPSSARDRPLKSATAPAPLAPPMQVHQNYTYARPLQAPAPQVFHPPMNIPPPQQDETASFKPIAVGDRLPPAHIDLHGVCVNLQEFFKNRNGIIFGLVGAFNPIDTDKAVPAILKAQEHFERLVDFVGCLVVNDPFVVKAWAKKLGVVDQFTFIADSDAKFTKVLGMAQYLPAEGLGIRSRRFAAVVGPRAKIRWIGFDDDSLADNVLLHLPRFVRTPWKSFLVGIGYSHPDPEEDARQREDTVNNLQSVRSLLANQGFCSEADWQLLLCDKMLDVFTPTRDNILNGLRWVVEGAQAGDVLCFYFAGKGGRYITEDGTETVGLLPMDHEVAGPIDEWEIYDTLAPHVPESCRLTIILDIHNESPVHCPMPYVYSSKVSVSPSGDMEAQILSSESIQWRERCSADPALGGEILVISLHGHTPVPSGCLSSLLTNVCVPEDRRDDYDQPLTYADQMDRMQVQLVEWQAEKNVQLSTSRPLNLNEEFTLADVLP